MDRKTLLIAVAAVNIAVPTSISAADRETCEAEFTRWMFQTDLVSGVLRTRDGIAIALNEVAIDALAPEEAEHVRKCIEALTAPDADIPPEQWPLRPDEEI